MENQNQTPKLTKVLWRRTIDGTISHAFVGADIRIYSACGKRSRYNGMWVIADKDTEHCLMCTLTVKNLELKELAGKD